MVSPRLTLRLSDSLLRQLETTAHQRGMTVSDIARQLLAYPGVAQPTSPHTPGDCAAALVQRCIPEVRAGLQAHAAEHRIPLDALVTAILGTWLRRRQAATRREAEPPRW